jgi:hypothetical protein
MASLQIIGQDAMPLVAPDPPDFVPAAPPKWAGDASTGPQSTKAANADDSGALWWDHDEPGQSGHGGYTGAAGVAGTSGIDGGDTPLGIRITITKTIDGAFSIEAKGGNGQSGGQGGAGGPGGEGQDGGDSDDEQPAGVGGQGGMGGAGGPGGNGGRGGNINEFDVVIGVPVNTSMVGATYEQGLGGLPGPGGVPGPGGPGGRAGSGGPQQISGFQGPAGAFGTRGKQGYVTPMRVVV